MDVLEQVREQFSEIKNIDKEALRAERDNLVEARSRLLKCEASACREIESKIREIDLQLKVDLDYPKLDPSFYKATVEIDGIIVPKFSTIEVTTARSMLRLTAKRFGTFRGVGFTSGSDNENGYGNGGMPNVLRESAFEIMHKNESLVANKSMHSCQRVVLAWKMSLAIAVIGTLAVGFGWSWTMCWIPAVAVAVTSLISLALSAMFYDTNNRCAKLVITDHIGDMVIPDNVRDTIKNLSDKFDKMWLLREATWDVDVSIDDEEVPSKIGQRLNPDPILLGQKDDNLYVLECFDLSTSEEYIKREFAVQES